MSWIAPTVLAGAVSLALSPVVATLLDRALVRDEPTWRSSHTRPVPRGGGIAVAIAVVLVLTAVSPVEGHLLAAVLVVGFGLGAVGLADDLCRGIPPLVRFVATGAIAATALVVLATGEPAWSVPAGLMAVGWIVAYVNAFNFMDGINGISVAQTVVGGVALALAGHQLGDGDLTVIALVVAGAALGFAPSNIPSARLFLGDVGSYLLGGLLALLVVVAIVRGAPVEAATFPFVLYAADTAVTLLRRMVRGERWWDAHREHTYQQLVDGGWSHVATAGFVALACASTSVLGLASFALPATGRVVAAVAAAAIVVGYLATPAMVRGRRRAAVRGAPEAMTA